jgi:hypothetical protein
MSRIETFAAVVLVVLLIANVAVTVAVTKSVFYSGRQKLFQSCIVWLAPFVGALGVGMFLYSQRDNPTFDTRAYPERSEKASLISIDASGHGYGHTE